MFHRHRSASSNSHRQVVRWTPNPAAATAASQAFLKSQNQAASLSAAAAATALRTYASSTTNVAQVQTKRMQRRGSTSSVRSSGSGSLKRRRNSMGSLTERTFRMPSPIRSHPVSRKETAAPPVPQLPLLPSKIPRLSAIKHRRTVSLEHGSHLQAPVSKLPHGRGVSVDRAIPLNEANQTLIRKVQEVDDDLSRRSINYSRPISHQSSGQSSPVSVSTPYTTSRGGWFTGPTISGQPPRGMQKRIAHEHGSGSYHELGATVLADPRESKLTSDPIGISQKAKNGSTQQDSPGLASSKWSAPVGQQTRASAVGEAVTSRKSFQPAQLQKSPAENNANASIRDVGQYIPLSASNHHRSIGTQTAEEEVPATPKAYKSLLKITPSQGKDLKQQAKMSSVFHNRSTSAAESSYEPQAQQIQAPGAVKYAHFPSTPAAVANGVRHDPPPRSISPTKSALKSIGPASSNSAPPLLNSSQSLQTVVAKPQIPASESPNQGKQSRTSFKNNMKQPSGGSLLSSKHASLVEAKAQPHVFNELDANLQPRPMLPSFDSIRAPKQIDARTRRSEDINGLSSNSRRKSEKLGYSSDNALGALLAHDLRAGQSQASRDKNETMVGLDPKQPVTPEITLVQGAGKSTDSKYEFYSKPSALETPQRTTPVKRLDLKIDSKGGAAGTRIQMQSTSKSISETASKPGIQSRNQTVEEQDRNPVMPGAFPELSSETESLSQDTSSEPNSRDATKSPLPGTAHAMLFSRPGSVKVVKVDTDESSYDGNSIYSDAPEIPEEFEDTSYSSLDAVLEDYSTYVSAFGQEVDQPVEPGGRKLETEHFPGPVERLQESRGDSEDQNGVSHSGEFHQIKQYKPDIDGQNEPAEPEQIDSKGLGASNSVLKPAEGLETSRRSLTNSKVVGEEHENKTSKFSALIRRVSTGSAQGPQRSESIGSESSFQRIRASIPKENGECRMKKTMRDEKNTSATAAEEKKTTGSFETNTFIREDRQAQPHNMRSSLRGSNGSAVISPQRRPQSSPGNRLKSPSRLSSLIRTSISKATSRPSPQFQSRFADDSDDDSVRPAFLSRFADSDDESELPRTLAPLELAPVRGISRHAGQQDGESTELEDEVGYTEEQQAETEKKPPSPDAKSSSDIKSNPANSETEGVAASKHAPSTQNTSSTRRKRRPSFMTFNNMRRPSFFNSNDNRPSLDSDTATELSPKEPEFPVNHRRPRKLQRKNTPKQTPKAPATDGNGAAGPVYTTQVEQTEHRPTTSGGTGLMGSVWRPRLKSEWRRRSTGDLTLPGGSEQNVNQAKVVTFVEGNSGEKPKTRFQKFKRALAWKKEEVKTQKAL